MRMLLKLLSFSSLSQTLRIELGLIQLKYFSKGLHMTSHLDVLHGFMPYPPVPSEHSASGPLAGLTFAVKDLFDVRGYPTSCGQPLLLALSGIKVRTAPTVQCLLDAGACLVGKAITDELAYSIVGSNAHFGSPINASSPDRYTGGSSTGSAAVVAAGLVDFSLGTDTGGSVRAPASNCGLFGIRPSHGRVSLQSCMDLAPSFDTCGWFARDIDTFVKVADVLLAQDERDAPSTYRLIEPKDVWTRHSTEINDSANQALKTIRPVFSSCESTDVALESFDEMLKQFRAIQGFESWKVHGEFIEKLNPVLGPGVAERFRIARQVTEQEYNNALNFKSRFRHAIDAILKDDGVMLIPTMVQLSPLRSATLEELDAYRANTFRYLCIAGLASLPQITLPVMQVNGAPLGLSLIGARGTDQSLVSIARKVIQEFSA